MIVSCCSSDSTHMSLQWYKLNSQGLSLFKVDFWVKGKYFRSSSYFPQCHDLQVILAGKCTDSLQNNRNVLMYFGETEMKQYIKRK